LATASYGLSVLARVVGLGLTPIVVRRFKAVHLLVGAAVVVAGYAAFTGGRVGPVRSVTAGVEGPGYNAIRAPAVQSALETVLPGTPNLDSLRGQPLVNAGEGGDEMNHGAATDAPMKAALAWWTRPFVLARILLVVGMLAGMMVISLDVLEIERE